jgi:hypothetical protein
VIFFYFVNCRLIRNVMHTVVTQCFLAISLLRLTCYLHAFFVSILKRQPSV